MLFYCFCKYLKILIGFLCCLLYCFDVKAIKHKLYIEQIKISCSIIVNRKHLFQLYTHKNINNTTKVTNYCKTFYNFHLELIVVKFDSVIDEYNLKSFNKLDFIISDRKVFH